MILLTRHQNACYASAGGCEDIYNRCVRVQNLSLRSFSLSRTQSDTKALHSTPLDSANCGSHAAKKNRPYSPNNLSLIRTASPSTKLPHRDYPQPDRRGTGDDDPVTSRGHASISDEVVLLEAETERILATQGSSISLRSEVQRPRRGASIRHPRPIRNKISSLKGAAKTNYTRHQIREITTEPNVPASANVVAAKSCIFPTLNTQHDTKPSVETQGRSYNLSLIHI